MTWAPPSPVSTYEVVLLTDLWCVTPLGATLGPCYSKDAAVSAATAAAERHRPSRVIVHDETGVVEDVRTYTDDAGTRTGAWRVAFA